MSGCECKPDAKRKRDSAQPEAERAAIKKRIRIVPATQTELANGISSRVLLMA
jgi:hypothetical protein